MNNELCHYGVKGMKWGVRKSSSHDNAESKKTPTKDTTKNSRKKQIVEKGAKAASKVIGNVGMAYVTDQVFNNGIGTKIAKEVIKQTGRAAITAYTMARGGYDIKWYDN